MLVGTDTVFITLISITKSDLSSVSANAISVIRKLSSWDVIGVHSDWGFDAP